ncbi:protein of unknown function DUF490 [Solidesulfovibrio carbinoliphilus subsp. oakridgensis]|uniref:Translocation and assembly module TamB C-terminal domain-containing protein n=1 Tax=Solidesulfovibrio carbinoliphilus subsp. oakridgensis TaxID=694327 RepID=G7QA02_9BACT|nr:translocation/assembly module TamB domain-containing protein [Solidesulfovibrio carbinoliphilus]EHJ47832.1 protein of unknown function DUF490 [Solidesulfovibrio carbinoliphilus subsp. oakridgensis]
MLGLVLLVWGLLLTPFGLGGAARVAERLIAAGSGMQARIENVSGVLPVSLSVGRFALADAKGPWLIVKDARLSWSPLALLRGRVEVREVAADIVRLRRAPALPPAAAEPMPLEWPPRFPRLPAILVDRLSVGRLILDKEVAGQAAVISISGRLAESGRGAVGLTLAATRQDGDKPLALRLAGSLNYADWRLAAKASLTDAPGGLLSAVLAGPDGGPLALDLTGDGPLDAWKGRLVATLSQKELLGLDLGLGVPLQKDATASFSLDAAATLPDGLLPEAVSRLVGQAPTCRLAGRYGLVSEDLFLDRLDASAAVGSLTATAGLKASDNTMTATAKLSLPDAARLDPSLAGVVEASLDASGHLSRPILGLRLVAKDVRSGPLALGAADLTARAEPTGDLSGPFPGATLSLAGNLTNLAGPEGTTLLGDDLALSLTAAVDGQGGIAAKALTITGKGGEVRLTDAGWQDGQAAGRLALNVADVAGAASLAGLKLSGSLATTADLTADAAGAGKATLTLRFADLAGRDPADTAAAALAALLGASPTLDLKAAFSPAGAELSELSLAGKAVTLTATGSVDARGQPVAAKVAAKIPDLSALGPALGQKAGGSLELSAEATSPAGAPHLQAKATADKLVLGDLALAAVTLDASATDALARPAGKLLLTARREGESARLETAFALAGDRLTVSDLKLAAPDAAFSGNAVLDTRTGRVSGKLSGNAANLAGLGRFVGQTLAGSLRLTATAEAKPAGQSLALDLSGANLRLPGVAAASLTVGASLDDVTGNPRGKATVAGKGVDAGGLSLATLSVAATGDGKLMAATVEAKGTIPGDKPLELATRATLAPAGQGRKLTLTALAGSLDARKFALTAPAVLTFGDGTTRLDGLALAYDKAVLTAQAAISPKQATAKATVDRFPLPLLSSFGLTGVDGTASATVTLSGSPARPELAADLRCEGVKMAAENTRGAPPLSVRATAGLSGGKATVKAVVAPNGKKEAVTLEAALPVRFAVEPFVFDLPQGGSLTGRLLADTDLSDLAPLLAQANTRATGRLTADLALGGSLAAPTVSGAMALAASRFENADSGLVLRALTLRAEAANGVLTIVQGAGQDTKGGSFTLSGSVGFADPVNGPVDLTLRLSKLQVAGLDQYTAKADGTIAVKGTLSRMQASGALTIGPADINLPTNLPPSVVVIPVVYVNDPRAPKTKPKPTPPAAARHIDLDLKIALGQAVYVRGMGLESRWGGEIAVTGTAAAPVVIGKYYVEKGLVELFGSNLEITKGDVVFRGESPPAPTLDILAETTSDDVTAGVSITGDAGNPSINLTSNPPLPHDEVLSRILFGQSAATLSPIQAAQLAQAAASLYAGGSPTSILARTRRILGLDQLTLVSGKGGISSTVVKATKEIVKGVNVGVEQGLGAQSGAVSVEVQVTPNITVDSRVGVDNKQGVGVNWKWDY